MKLSLTTYAKIGIVAVVIVAMAPTTQAASNQILMGKCANHTDFLMAELSKISGSDDDDKDSHNAQKDRALRTYTNADYEPKKWTIKWNWNGEEGKIMYWLNEFNPYCFNMCFKTYIRAFDCIKIPRCKMPQYWDVLVPPYEIIFIKRHLREKGDSNSLNVPYSPQDNAKGQHTSLEAPDMMCNKVQQAIHTKLQELSETGNDSGLQDCVTGLLGVQALHCDTE